MTCDPSTWTNIATTIAAWLALLLSLAGLVMSHRAQRLAEQQEARRRPVLVPYLVDGYIRMSKNPDGRSYGFLLSVSNPADSDNSVAAVDLHLSYTTRANLQMTAKVRADSGGGASFLERSGSTLSLPARLDAHQTAAGWVFFRVDEAVLQDAVIDGYSVVLTDTHGLQATVKPIIVREYGDEVEIPPSTDSDSHRA